MVRQRLGMDDLLSALTTAVAMRGQLGLDYACQNPGTGEVANKHSVPRKVGELLVGVG